MSDEIFGDGLPEDTEDTQDTKEVAKDDKKSKKADKADKKTTSKVVDSISVEILQSVPTFFHGGEYLSYKLGDKVKVSKALKNILVARGVAKVL